MHSLPQSVACVPADEHTSSPQVPSLRVTAGSVCPVGVDTGARTRSTVTAHPSSILPWSPLCSAQQPLPPTIPWRPFLFTFSSPCWPLLMTIYLSRYNLLVLIFFSKVKNSWNWLNFQIDNITCNTFWDSLKMRSSPVKDMRENRDPYWLQSCSLLTCPDFFPHFLLFLCVFSNIL